MCVSMCTHTSMQAIIGTSVMPFEVRVRSDSKDDLRNKDEDARGVIGNRWSRPPGGTVQFNLMMVEVPFNLMITQEKHAFHTVQPHDNIDKACISRKWMCMDTHEPTPMPS